MVIQTTRFGEIDIETERVIELPDGLIGLPEERRFCLLESGLDSPFRWLQSIDRGDLAFLVINPYDFFSDYEIYVADEVAEELKLNQPEEAGVLALVSIQEGKSLTANLIGPVVVNTRTGAGRQLVLENERYSTRHVIASKEQGSVSSAA